MQELEQRFEQEYGELDRKNFQLASTIQQLEEKLAESQGQVMQLTSKQEISRRDLQFVVQDQKRERQLITGSIFQKLDLLRSESGSLRSMVSYELQGFAKFIQQAGEDLLRERAKLVQDLDKRYRKQYESMFQELSEKTSEHERKSQEHSQQEVLRENDALVKQLDRTKQDCNKFQK